MTAPTTLVRAGEVWPTTRIGWTALIDTLRERAARVYGPAVAQRIDDGLKIARLHAADFPEEWTAADVRGFAWLYGPLLTEVRDQPEPLPDDVAAERLDDALTDFLLVADRPGNTLTGFGAHAVTYLHGKNTQLTGGRRG